MPTYHCHIYFTEQTTALAEQVRANIIAALPFLTYHGHLIHCAIGPHPQPMFELHFSAEQLANATETINELRAHLSVLIHPVQHDELEAHTRLAIWLGEPLTLDLNALPPT